MVEEHTKALLGTQNKIHATMTSQPSQFVLAMPRNATSSPEKKNQDISTTLFVEIMVSELACLVWPWIRVIPRTLPNPLTYTDSLAAE
ncbi:hypothetical protein PISMIDRAFT_674473 [Pisolithus microcarpus 441]|uniref:Unplaced genomic scaffold scaffold_11, whole genome shotgun sequence n=1 Tax=Pisolithus microcarpus 441 TaxID=765257 RepID=A0A0C9ZE71_9AGAM|nr:hypothetical protein PISMIDRAFT_674473 [Pisolithus microcarpus 441]